MDGLLAPDEVMLDYMMSGDGVPRRPLAGMLGPFLPFTVPVEGKGLRVAVPPILSDIQDAVMAPLQAYRGELDDPVSSAQNLAGMVTGGGLLVGTPTRQAAAESGQAMLGAGGGQLTKPQMDPMGYSAIKLDKRLSDVDFDMEPVDLLGQRMVINPADLQNKILLFGAGDRSAVGTLKGIEGQPFDTPVDALGGRDYQLATPYAWASDEGVVRGLLNKAKKAQEETGIEDVILAHSTMNPRTIDFTEMQSSAVAEMLKTAKITKKDAKTFDNEIKKSFPDFVGVKSPKFREWMANAGGETRKVIIRKMDTDEYRKKGFPFIGKARYALTEEAQRDVPTFESGLSFVPLDLAKGATKEPIIPHGSYNTAMLRTGDPVQFSGTVPNEILYRDFFKTIEGATTKSGAPQTASMKQYTTRLNNPYQVVDQELVDTLSGLLGD